MRGKLHLDSHFLIVRNEDLSDLAFRISTGAIYLGSMIDVWNGQKFIINFFYIKIYIKIISWALQDIWNLARPNTKYPAIKMRMCKLVRVEKIDKKTWKIRKRHVTEGKIVEFSYAHSSWRVSNLIHFRIKCRCTFKRWKVSKIVIWILSSFCLFFHGTRSMVRRPLKIFQDENCVMARWTQFRTFSVSQDFVDVVKMEYWVKKRFFYMNAKLRRICRI